MTMLFGHTGAVTSLAMANNTADNTFIVSSADNGYFHCYFLKQLLHFSAFMLLLLYQKG